VSKRSVYHIVIADRIRRRLHELRYQGSSGLCPSGLTEDDRRCLSQVMAEELNRLYDVVRHERDEAQAEVERLRDGMRRIVDYYGRGSVVRDIRALLAAAPSGTRGGE
jgi:hypothetical protein